MSVETAPLREWTFLAFRGAGGAGVAAVEDEPVVGYGALFYRDVAFQVPLYVQWGFAVGEAKAVSNPENVCVYGYDGLIVNY